LFLNATVCPADAGTGFGLNEFGPSEKAPMFTVMFGPLDPVPGDVGVEPPDEPPQLIISKAPATPNAAPDSSGVRMLLPSSLIRVIAP
jgi:hypothetical protein